MQRLNYTFPASKTINRPAHVGVVGSGDLEVLIEPSDNNTANFEIRTGIIGFSETWKKVIERFVSQNDIAANITINDFGATPGVVSIRLAQAVEVSANDTINN
ncbi:MAG TPA: malonate decarboxylase subunit delta [Ureibacillus sp.]|nr:malonate decarboxylase subunit delta [Ureibacillus sp.]